MFVAKPYTQIFYQADAENPWEYIWLAFISDGPLPTELPPVLTCPELIPLFESLNINKDNNCFKGLQNTIDFWVDSIRRVNPNNANTLTESVLMYTLSYIANFDKKEKPKSKDKFDIIIDYINHNFTSSDISLGKIGDIFYYTEKHLSYLFINKMGVKFTQYITDLRIHYAKRLIEGGNKNVSEIAFKCGYTDRFYFSKIFKKSTGITPTEFIAKYGENASE
jgi:YesN/AraC family two-component response regulator